MNITLTFDQLNALGDALARLFELGLYALIVLLMIFVVIVFAAWPDDK